MHGPARRPTPGLRTQARKGRAAHRGDGAVAVEKREKEREPLFSNRSQTYNLRWEQQGERYAHRGMPGATAPAMGDAQTDLHNPELQ